MDMEEDEDENNLQPNALDTQFQRAAEEGHTTTGDIVEKIRTDNWSTKDWDNPQFFETLLEAPKPPSAGEVLDYEFDEEDDTTRELLPTVNAYQIGETMRSKVLRLMHQERSRMNPKYSPFRLITLSRDPATISVLNCKGVRAYTFKQNEHSLGVEGMEFDVKDRATYSVLCTAGPSLLWQELLEIRKQSNRTVAHGHGPFRISWETSGGNTIIFINKLGEKVNSSLTCEPNGNGDRWITVLPQTARASGSINANPPSNGPKGSSDNRYALLSDEEENADTDMIFSETKRPTRQAAPGVNPLKKTKRTATSKRSEGTVANPREEDFNHTTTSPSLMHQKISFKVAVEQHSAWADDESGNEAEDPGEDQAPPVQNLQDIMSPGTVSTESSATAISGLTTSMNLAEVVDAKSGQILLNLEIQLQPGKEHLDVLLAEAKNILAYIQSIDPAAKYVSKQQSGNRSSPALSNPKDKNWPTTYLAASNWFHTTTGYLFKQPPITEQELRSHLASRQARRSSVQEITTHSKSTASTRTDRGPVAMYATVNLYTTIVDTNRLIESLNIDLRKSNVKITKKELQCWESKSRKMLCGVKSGLCVAGVQQLLAHQLKETEKKLCRHGKLSTIEWYDEPLPAFTVSARPIRSLKLPTDKKEHERLSFDPFPWESKMAYFMEASDEAWTRLEPLLKYMMNTPSLCQAFGPAACFVDTPDLNPNMDRVRAHHKHGRISMGYNLATTIIECSEVQMYDYDVKLVMEEVDEVDSAGNKTGKKIRPKPPHATTNLRKELQHIQFNGEQVFHTAIMIGKGPERGLSSVVVSYDPADPDNEQKFSFAKRTITNIAAFMHHWWIKCGYNHSTRYRLMRSFYADPAHLASQSTWDEETFSAHSHFAERASTYLEEFSRYDPLNKPKQGEQDKGKLQVVEMSDTLRSNLLKGIGYTKGEKGDDIGSKVSGVSKHTNGGDSSQASTINSDTNRVLRTRDLAIQLATSSAKQAEQEAIILQLKEQLNKMTSTAGSSAEEGAPHLSGSGVSPPGDPGGGETPQGK